MTPIEQTLRERDDWPALLEAALTAALTELGHAVQVPWEVEALTDLGATGVIVSVVQDDLTFGLDLA